MVAVSGYVTALSKENEVTELKCIWQDATTQMRAQPQGYVQYTAIHQLILCGTDISSVKPKIALAKVNRAPHAEPGKALPRYTNCNISQKKGEKQVEEQQMKLSHSSEGDSG